MKAEIIEHGRGPTIAGTRITVYTIMDYLKMGWPRDRIAGHLRLGSAEVQAAIEYIDSHQDTVNAVYQRLVEQAANAKNPPWVEAIRAKGHAKLLALREERRQAKLKENGDAWTDAGP